MNPAFISLSSLPPTGPILLEDYQLTEKLANFDRERIPERVVHARGAAAKGFFEVKKGGGWLGWGRWFGQLLIGRAGDVKRRIAVSEQQMGQCRERDTAGVRLAAAGRGWSSAGRATKRHFIFALLYFQTDTCLPACLPVYVGHP